MNVGEIYILDKPKYIKIYLVENQYNYGYSMRNVVFFKDDGKVYYDYKEEKYGNGFKQDSNRLFVSNSDEAGFIKRYTRYNLEDVSRYVKRESIAKTLLLGEGLKHIEFIGGQSGVL